MQRGRRHSPGLERAQGTVNVAGNDQVDGHAERGRIYHADGEDSPRPKRGEHLEQEGSIFFQEIFQTKQRGLFCCL